MNKEKDIKSFLAKVDKIKRDNDLDLSSQEDLSIAIMNLIGLEEHFFFSAEKTGDDKYYDLLFQVREMRKELLKKIVKNPKGEEWCISKHLLTASMRLIEVATKYYSKGDKEEAKNLFSKAYSLYSIFWGLNLNVIDASKSKKITGQVLHSSSAKETDISKRLNNLVEELVNCCDE
jgi:hypothetical protein